MAWIITNNMLSSVVEIGERFSFRSSMSISYALKKSISVSKSSSFHCWMREVAMANGTSLITLDTGLNKFSVRLCPLLKKILFQGDLQHNLYSEEKIGVVLYLKQALYNLHCTAIKSIVRLKSHYDSIQSGGWMSSQFWRKRF